MGMGNRITVRIAIVRNLRRLSGALVFFSALSTGAAHAAQIDCEGQADVAALQQAQQKIVLLERMIGNTEPARRVMEGDNSDAQAAIEAARAAAAEAREKLSMNCAAAAADHASSGLKLASTAFRIGRNETVRSRQEFRSLRARTASYLATLESQPEEVRGIGEDDLVGMQRQISRSDVLARGDSFAAAIALLYPVSDRLERRLIAILNDRTVYYEKTFEGPSDEFAYLMQQYQGYRMLLDGSDVRQSLLFNNRRAFDDALSRADQFRREAETTAGNEDWRVALDKISDALKECETATRLSGIYN